MIFNKYNNCRQFSNEKINLEELITTIKQNPHKLEITRLRNIAYKSTEYDKIKLLLPVVTPHGTFVNSKKDGISTLSGYMYFDIDGFKNSQDVNQTIKKLSDSFPVSLICRSVGGRGLAFLLKVSGVTIENFDSIHAFIRHDFKNNGYKIDDAAGGLVRKWIITYDPEVICNYDNEYIIDQTAYDKFIEGRKTTGKKAGKRNADSELNSDLDEIIPFSALCKLIKTESEFDKEIEGDFTIEEMEYYKIIYPAIIKDGNKHRTYIRIINALYYLNPTITQQQILSYLFYINTTAEAKMPMSKLKLLVKNICGRIEQTKDILIKIRLKKIHFNKDSNLTKTQKQSMAGKINGALKSNKTKEAIQQAIAEMEADNIKPTRKNIAEILGISQKTVQRNWKKELTDISTLDFTSCKQTKMMNNNLTEVDYYEDYITEDIQENFIDDDFDFWAD
ncbi:BT4734/BF3469 family protein [Flavobacterium sp.]|uniref:BT4734/BF3469 family protein n=1 Tax=Flavobacterium sp. TaxID=239 RepID=UPI002ED83694